MANSPQGYSKADVENRYPGYWTLTNIAGAIEQVPTRRKFDAKSVASQGNVPVLDQKAEGYFGFHDGNPDVLASSSDPVVTFSNHRCVVRLITRPFSTIQNVFVLRGKDDFVDTRFLFYLIRDRVEAKDYKGYFPTLKDIWLGVPPLDEQRKIAGVLGALDDLIEVNRKLAADCRELRQVMLQSAMNDAADSRPLSQLARFVNGKNFTKEASGSGRPVIRTPELRRGPVEGTIYSNATPDADFIATAGDVLFVWSGSLMVDRWVFEDGLVNQHIFKVISNGLPDWFIHGAIERQMPWFLGLAADKATTMGHIQRAHLDATVPVPSKEEMDRLGEVAQPLWDQELQCALEVRELTSARDELLPLLMTGRVRVGDVAA